MFIKSKLHRSVGVAGSWGREAVVRTGNPERQCCPKCGGFGFVKSEPEEDLNSLPIIGKEKGNPS